MFVVTKMTTYLTPQQIHNRWGIHTESIRRMVRQGRLPALKIGKRIRVAEKDIQDFEKNCKIRIQFEEVR